MSKDLKKIKGTAKAAVGGKIIFGIPVECAAGNTLPKSCDQINMLANEVSRSGQHVKSVSHVAGSDLLRDSRPPQNIPPIIVADFFTSPYVENFQCRRVAWSNADLSPRRSRFHEPLFLYAVVWLREWSQCRLAQWVTHPAKWVRQRFKESFQKYSIIFQKYSRISNASPLAVESMLIGRHFSRRPIGCQITLKAQQIVVAVRKKQN